MTAAAALSPPDVGPDWDAIHARLDDVRARALVIKRERDALFAAAMEAYTALSVGGDECEMLAKQALRRVLARASEVEAK